VYELASLMGFDAIWMDMEHHGYSLETAGNLMRAARVGTADILARPAKGEFMRMGRMLEAGAQGIMYPRCSSAQEAAEVVKWAKFAPLGRRGIDGGNADVPYCAMNNIAEYTRQANEQTFIVIQLEEAEAIDQAEEIAQVEGVDILMLGPADFTVLSGIPGRFDHELVEQATRKIAAAARKAGKHWGRPVASAQDAARLLDMGARLICHSGDILILKQGLEQIQEQFSALGFSFDNRLSSQTVSCLTR
jgi:4-hydroxy-2-oxoheptanedioate aldolase